MFNAFKSQPPGAKTLSHGLYPQAAPLELRNRYVDENLQGLDGPQAIIDLSVVRRNCRLMLETADALDVRMRCHVKTHKTVELTKLQVGDAPRDVNLIVSTVAEAEYLLDYLIECKQQGRNVNVIYGIPPSSTCFPRLDDLRKHLGPTSISFLIDHASQLQYFVADPKVPVDQVQVLIKIDTGYHRAGVPPNTQAFENLLETVLQAQSASSQPNIRLQGFYSHSSKSYNVDSPSGALEYLEQELLGNIAAAEKASALGFKDQRLTLSAGATPSASSAQNLIADASHPTAQRLKSLIKSTQVSHDVELHAGVYTVLDLQQLATHARPLTSSATPTMTTDDIGLRILGEVLSTYPANSRSPDSKPEALLGAGTLALGREPCKAYEGWGVMAPAPWGNAEKEQIWDEEERRGWIVGRVSQEHGILCWEDGNAAPAAARVGDDEGMGIHGEKNAGDADGEDEKTVDGDQIVEEGPSNGSKKCRELRVGEKVLIWPNHACIAADGFGWFLVVDPEVEGGKKVVDVWVKCRGW